MKRCAIDFRQPSTTGSQLLQKFCLILLLLERSYLKDQNALLALLHPAEIPRTFPCQELRYESYLCLSAARNAQQGMIMTNGIFLSFQLP